MNVIRWTNLVINSISDMHWRCIGYERNVNGDNDISKPLYSILNPNELLQLISEEYGRSAKNSLEILYDEVMLKKHVTPASNNMAVTYGADPSQSVISSSVSSTEPTSQQLLLTSSTTSSPNFSGGRLTSLSRTQSETEKKGSINSINTHNTAVVSGSSLDSFGCQYSKMNTREEAAVDVESQESEAPALVREDLIDNSVILTSRVPVPKVSRSLSGPSLLSTVPSTSAGISCPPSLSRCHTQEFLDSLEFLENIKDEDYDPNGIYYILAKPYVSKATGKLFGIAAFDVNKTLLGFYRDESVDGSAVNVRLSSVTDCEDLTVTDVTALTDQLEEESLDDAENSNVLSLPQFYSNLKDMVDHAFVRCWNLSG
mmetsp:Transcript_724/g.732  ORF Transcript_724/g.732 Transcript_724/m.732 type:complete len:371 (-) Transcript_724:143-1255(-)